ncbi:MAG: hypothetical protein ACXWLR_10935 [Myxococcales bacterium]
MPCLLALAAATCGSNDNSIFEAIPSSEINPLIEFDNVGSVISGRLSLRDADGAPTGDSAQVVIVSDRPNLCDRLKATPAYFRDPPEAYIALILFIPPTNHLGTFEPGRSGDEGTGSEIFGSDPAKRQTSIDKTGMALAPFKAVDAGYIALRDWSEAPGGESAGSFYLLYGPPPPYTTTNGFLFQGNFKATVCPTLEGTLLP